MTDKEGMNVGGLLLIITLVICCIIMVDRLDKVKAEKDAYRQQRDSTDVNFTRYRDSVDRTLDTCFVIGKSNHRLIKKYIRE